MIKFTKQTEDYEYADRILSLHDEIETIVRKHGHQMLVDDVSYDDSVVVIINALCSNLSVLDQMVFRAGNPRGHVIDSAIECLNQNAKVPVLYWDNTKQDSDPS